MYQRLKFQIKGLNPLLMHNGKILTNPLLPLTKEVKKITSKGAKKTEQDLMTLAHLEWLGGMYTTKPFSFKVLSDRVEVQCEGVPCIPRDVIMSVLVGGAKKSKLGNQFKSGVTVRQDFPLIYEGETDLVKMWDSGNYVDARRVVVRNNAVIRTRPIFYEWALDLCVDYLPSVVNAGQIERALQMAGELVGLCDYRPLYGQFKVV